MTESRMNAHRIMNRLWPQSRTDQATLRYLHTELQHAQHTPRVASSSLTATQHRRRCHAHAITAALATPVATQSRKGPISGRWPVELSSDAALASASHTHHGASLVLQSQRHRPARPVLIPAITTARISAPRARGGSRPRYAHARALPPPPPRTGTAPRVMLRKRRRHACHPQRSHTHTRP